MGKRKSWTEMSAQERVVVITLAIGQLALLIAAQADIGRRPAEQIRGSKRLWRVLSLANYVGPIVYFGVGVRR